MDVRTFSQQTISEYTSKRSEEIKNEQSILYFFNDRGYVLKVFRYRDNEDKQKKSESLMQKLRILESMKKKSNLLVSYPEYAFKMDGICMGYTMKIIPNAETINEYTNRMKNGSIVERLETAEKLCIFLNNLHSYKHIIIVGDCHSDQFAITSDGVICIFDADTFGFKDYKIPAERVGKPDFVDPNVLDANNRVKEYTIESDWYSMAVITFKLLLGNISIYGGKCDKVKKKDRKKKRMTLLHQDDVELYGIPGFTIKQFAWMSIETQRAFLEILEGSKRYNLRDVFRRQLNDLAYCPKHNGHYSKSRYNCCPMCHLKEKEFFEAFSKQKVIRIDPNATKANTSNSNHGTTSSQNTTTKQSMVSSSNAASNQNSASGTNTANTSSPKKVYIANTNVKSVEEARKQFIEIKTQYEITKNIMLNGNPDANELNRLKSELINLDIQLQVARQVYDNEKSKQQRAQAKTTQAQAAPVNTPIAQTQAGMQNSPPMAQPSTNQVTIQKKNKFLGWIGNCWDAFVDMLRGIGNILLGLLAIIPVILSLVGVLFCIIMIILPFYFGLNGDVNTALLIGFGDIIFGAILGEFLQSFEFMTVMMCIGILAILGFTFLVQIYS